MNAGAHKQTISDFLLSARVFDVKENKIINLTKEQLDFSYRNSLIKKNPGRYVVLSAKFELESLTQILRIYLQVRGVRSYKLSFTELCLPCDIQSHRGQV